MIWDYRVKRYLVFQLRGEELTQLNDVKEIRFLLSLWEVTVLFFFSFFSFFFFFLMVAPVACGGAQAGC